ncbi:hypothetical protein [Sphingobium nicotianae]|uniref:Lipoprotein n=1 Tax=Sphingobium nicotianae TaxID=2782607 RepID=A0A9X1DBJ2_9SPHN|nr:hypothetical protein [Sphingobium nicotianae]MBT2186891.1 hypothetical protein [Sphingobium nicotianae]
MNMKPIVTIALCAAVFPLPGCVARTAYHVATAPVKVASKAADWATVSGDEADRNRGRVLRRKCQERYDEYYCTKD